MAAERYEAYRIITDYDALREGFVDRVEDLNISRLSIDEAGGFSSGHSSKLLCDPPHKVFGQISLGKMLKATGMVLMLVVDDEGFALVKSTLSERKRAPRPANAGSTRPTWLFTRDKAREMGKSRFAMMTDAQRKRHQRKAGKASARARRAKAALKALAATP